MNLENSNLEQIEDIINIVTQINQNDNPDMIDYLLKYKQLKETVELYISKPINGNFA